MMEEDDDDDDDDDDEELWQKGRMCNKIVSAVRQDRTGQDDKLTWIG